MAKDDNKDDVSVVDFSTSSIETKNNRTITITLPKFPKIYWRRILTKSQLLFLVSVLIIGVVGGLLGGWLESLGQQGEVLTASTNGVKKIVSNNHLIVNIANELSPSVVSIVANITNQSSSAFGFTQPIQEQSEGTGIIISSNGLVLTNRHVVPAGTTSISITLSNGTQLNNISVVGRTSTSDSLDIAILKINNAKGQKLIPAVLGNSSQVHVGDEVVAIGNALGQFQNTVTSGIISGYGRNIEASSSGGSNILGGTSSGGENLTDMFQTDAAINEGNSGGPLVNLNGQVIGVNTAIASNSQNIGFAIPINEITGLIKEVVTTGKFERPLLGVRFVLLNPQLQKQYHLKTATGAYIPKNTDGEGAPIVAGSAAAKAGLKPGDIITAVNGSKINQMNDLSMAIDQYEPGAKVKLSVDRGSKSLTLTAILGETSS